MNLDQKKDIQKLHNDAISLSAPNRNGRVYPKELLDLAMAEFAGIPHGRNYEKKFTEII